MKSARFGTQRASAGVGWPVLASLGLANLGPWPDGRFLPACSGPRSRRRFAPRPSAVAIETNAAGRPARRGPEGLGGAARRAAAGRAGRSPARQRPTITEKGKGRNLKIPDGVFRRLTLEAARRGTDLSKLVTRILDRELPSDIRIVVGRDEDSAGQE
jgi:hypothetical protein